MKIVLVGGARPNFMKIAPLIWELRGRVFRDFRLVHTGQHYDYAMSKVFFEDLDLPEPDYFLDVGSSSHAVQTAKIMIAFEAVCDREKPDLVIVVGDVNSTLACAVVAKKRHIRVAHIEAGLRSFDRTMPEEINRLATDAISDDLFVTEKSGLENLRHEGQPEDRIFFCGNIMIDTLFFQKEKLGAERSPHAPRSAFSVLTLHRPSNVDEPGRLRGILEAMVSISRVYPMVFPVHPRTQKQIERFGLKTLLEQGGMTLLDPLSYMDFLRLWRDAAAVFTDRGGIQEETTALLVPCFTLRENTERPITIEQGTNVLAGTERAGILAAFDEFRASGTRKGAIPELWDGRAAARIVARLLDK